MADDFAQTNFNIHILQTGYARTDPDGKYRARCTCSLVTGPINIIVDPGGAWEKDSIIDSINKSGLSCDDISVVVGTHGHSDHIGNLNLFPNAKHIVCYDINMKDEYEEHDFHSGKPYTIWQDLVEVLPTPGHTAQDVTVLVKGVTDMGTVAICGDLFECKDDDGTWQEVSVDQELQSKNRESIIELCDFIVPGHGPMFSSKSTTRRNKIDT